MKNQTIFLWTLVNGKIGCVKTKYLIKGVYNIAKYIKDKTGSLPHDIGGVRITALDEDNGVVWMNARDALNRDIAQTRLNMKPGRYLTQDEIDSLLVEDE